MILSALPIHNIRIEFEQALKTCRPILLGAPTGSGKSTQLPQWILDSPHHPGGEVFVLQPRRLAARMLARRVSQERGVQLGGEIGYQIRHENRTGPETRLIFATEGVLLRRILAEPMLPGIGAIVFDEFHERHLYTDIMLTLARELKKSRPELRLLIMSATLEFTALQTYMPEAVVLRSEGRTFPITTEYLSKAPDAREPLCDTVATALERAHSRTSGHTLVFLPGAQEINRCLTTVRATHAARDCLVLPLHGELPPEQQDQAVLPGDTRKIILSTNVAETSLTIDDVDLVIDSGLARIARYDPHRGLDTLWVEKISRAAAEQRAGRAGRTRPGLCLRLWTRADHDARPPADTPEILRVDLAEPLLALAALGHKRWQEFPWFQPPDPPAADRALRLLRMLGALDEQNTPTALGLQLLEFPTHPRLARLIIEAHQRGCLRQAVLAAALTQARPVLTRPADRTTRELRDDILGSSPDSDFFPLFRALEFARAKNYHPEPCRKLGIHALAAREVHRIAEQLLGIAEAAGRQPESTPPASSEPFAKSLLAAFPDRLAKRLDQGTLRARTAEGLVGVVDDDSHIRDSPLFLSAEINEIGRTTDANARRAPGAPPAQSGQVRLSLNTVIRPEWIEELFPGQIRRERLLEWDVQLRRLTARPVVSFQQLILQDAAPTDARPEESAAELASRILSGELPLKLWDHRCENLLQRLHWAAQKFPKLALPEWNTEAHCTLLEQLVFGHHAYKDNKDLDPYPALLDWLGPAHSATLDTYAPTHHTLPSGRRARLTYRADGAAVISSRLQDFIGCDRTPLIGAGRVPALIELLAPNMRPVQVTEDLASFWKNTYPELRPALSRRYPKHQWP